LRRFQIGFVRRFLQRLDTAIQALLEAIALAHSVSRVRSHVGQDSHLVVRRVPYDTLENLFHALTQCQRWHRLAAFTFMAATPTSPRTGQSSCGTRHLPSAIADSELLDPELGPLGMRDMLRNATFSGFFENLRNQVLTQTVIQ